MQTSCTKRSFPFDGHVWSALTFVVQPVSSKTRAVLLHTSCAVTLQHCCTIVAYDTGITLGGIGSEECKVINCVHAAVVC